MVTTSQPRLKSEKDIVCISEDKHTHKYVYIYICTYVSTYICVYIHMEVGPEENGCFGGTGPLAIEKKSELGQS